MDRWILFLISILVCASLRAEEKQFFAVQSKVNYTCSCTFNESFKSANEGSYGSGAEVLVIASNENSPFALANFGKGDVKLEPIGHASYECDAGSIYSPSWKVGDIIIEAHLKVDRPGEESCWFHGTLSSKEKANIKTINIKGACGC